MRLVGKGTRPGLVAILVGEDPASQIYVRDKVNACEAAGLLSEKIVFPATPVPGGVGPMTITMLLANTVEAAERATR